MVSDLDGASSSCITTISVVDNVGPVFSEQPKQIKVTIPPGQTYTLPDYSIEFTAIDNCGLVVYSQNPAPGKIYSESAKEAISLVATDQLGNSSEIIITLTIAIKKIKIATIESIDENHDQFEFKVYPNPFTDAVFFELKLPEDADVRSDLYNGKGSKLETLFDGFLETTKSVKFEYVPRNISSQILFYKLTINEEEYSGKVTFTK